MGDALELGAEHALLGKIEERAGVPETAHWSSPRRPSPRPERARARANPPPSSPRSRSAGPR
eukprot:2123472-Pyramimonas_sp.AAC.1